MKKMLKRGLITLGAVGLVLALQMASAVLANSTDDFFSDKYTMAERVAHFNGLIFSNYTSENADVEGALAVGSRTNATTLHIGSQGDFDIGASWEYMYPQIGNYTNEKGYSTFLVDNTNILLNNDLGDSTNLSVHGPDPQIVMGASTLEVYESRKQKFTEGKVTGVSDETVSTWFDDAYTLVERMVVQYEDAGRETIAGEITWKEYQSIDESTSPEEYVNTTLETEGEVDDSILVLTITETGSVLQLQDNWQESSILHVPYEWLKNYDAIVFSFPEVVNLNAISAVPAIDGLTDYTYQWNWPDADLSAEDARARLAMGEKVVYSFPNASTINLQKSYICGSIIAPDAYVTGDGGSINGQLVADSLYQGGQMELHALRINYKVYDVVEEEDPEPTAGVTVWKYGETDGDMLAGVQFVIEESDGEGGGTGRYFNGETLTLEEKEYIFTTNQNGRVDVSGIPLGTYILREIVTKEGYTINTTSPKDDKTYFEYEFTLEEADEGKTIEIKRYNDKEAMDVYFKKTDAETGDLLEGAVFELIKYTGTHDYVHSGSTNIIVDTGVASDDEGQIYLEHLTEGKYCLHEIIAPEGYELSKDGHILFEVGKENGKLKVTVSSSGISGDGSEKDPFVIENEPQTPADPETPISGSVRILKYTETEDGYLGLEGAQFELYERDDHGTSDTEDDTWFLVDKDVEGNAYIQPFESEKDGIIEIDGLEEGEYRIVEISPPDGYEFDDAYTYDEHFINENEELIHDGIYEDEFVIGGTSYSNTVTSVYSLVENEPHRAYASIYKTGENPLYDGTDDSAEKWIPLENIRFGLARVNADGSEIVLGNDCTDASGLIPGAADVSAGEETSAPVNGISLKAGTFRVWESLLDETPNYQKLDKDIYFVLDFEQDGAAFIEQAWLADPADANTINNSVYNKDYHEKINADTSPVAIEVDEKNQIRISVQNELLTSGIRIVKYDKDILYDGLEEEQSESSYVINYLEGAEFQLYRSATGFNSNDFAAYGSSFTSEMITEGEDEGKAVASIDNLPYGYYQIVEVTPPAGYRTTTNGGIVGYFQITEDMVNSDGEYFYYDVINEKDTARGDLTVYKRDDEGNAVTDHDIPFKLWRFTAGTDDWDEDITIEEALAAIYKQEVEFYKWLTTDEEGKETTTFWTEDGVLKLEDIPEGIYVLFEMNDTEDPDFMDEYVYMLDDGKHTIVHDIEEFEEAFYYHTTLFEVVDDGEGGVKIAWIDRHKLWSGQAKFNGDEDEDEDLTIVNKLQENLYATLQFEKNDAETAEALDGATFGIYKKKAAADSDNGNLDDYDKVGDAVSKDGIVDFSELLLGVDFEWVGDPADHVMFTRYMIVEEEAPDGYVASEEKIYLRLVLNPDTKMIDIYKETESGQIDRNAEVLYGYDAGRSDADGYDEARFMTHFDITGLIDGLFANYSEDTITGEITVRKLDGTDEESVIGDAGFRLYKKNEAGEYKSYNGVYTTSQSDGEIVIRQLPAGEYYLQEVSSATGYVISEAALYFTLSEDTQNGQMRMEVTGETPEHISVEDQELVITVLNEPIQPIQVLLFKTDALSGDEKKLQGAEFMLEIWDDVHSSWIAYGETKTTDEDGILTWENLYEGKYRASEIKAPDGYSIPVGNSNHITFEIVKVSDEDGETLEIVFPNISTIPNPDAVSILTGADQDACDYITAGTRYEEEEYDVLAIVRNEQYEEPFGHVELQKTDADDSEKTLTGARFRLDVWINNVWHTVGGIRTTGADGTIRWDGLGPGSYRIVEVEAPDGYERLTDPIEFELTETEGGKTVSMEVTAPSDQEKVWSDDGSGHNQFLLPVGNEAVPEESAPQERTGQITVSKKSAEADEEGIGLAGTVFALHRYDGEIDSGATGEELKQLVSQADLWVDYPEEGENHFTTGADGTVAIDGLTEGLYKIDEIIPPEGYALYGGSGDTLYFIMEETNDEVVISGILDGEYNLLPDSGSIEGQLVLPFADKRLEPAGVEVLKTDEADGSLLAGAVFDLYVIEDGEEKLLEEGLTTDADGSLKLRLEYGSYVLIETEAPEGYVLPAKEKARHEFTLAADGTYTGLILLVDGEAADNIVITNEKEVEKVEEPMEVEVIKTDEVDGSLLAGAVFDLYVIEDGEEKLLEEGLTTDADGRLKFTLPSGAYVLIETKAPEGYVLPPEGADRYEFQIRAGDGDTGLMLMLNGKAAENIPVTNVKEDEEEEKETVLVLKVDEEDHGIRLAGAEFRLEQLMTGAGGADPVQNGTDTDETDPVDGGSAGDPAVTDPADPDGDTGDTSGNAGDSDGDDPGPAADPGGADVLEILPDAVQEAVAEEWMLVEGYELITGADGTIYLKGLPEGTYRLTEITPPEGYALEHEVVVVFKTDDKGALKAVIAGADSDKEYLQIENTAEEEPEEPEKPGEPIGPEEPGGPETPEAPGASEEPEEPEVTEEPEGSEEVPESADSSGNKKTASPATGVRDNVILLALLAYGCLLVLLWTYRDKVYKKK